jgi:phosphocarrier protein
VISCALTVSNPLGLHARAAARFVHAASGFASRVRVGRPGREMDGKSIMGLLLLSASQGTVITVTVDGPDEAEAISVLRALVERGFDEASFDAAHGKPDTARGGSCS